MAKPGPAPNPRGLLKPLLQVKCTAAYDEAVRKMAESDGINLADLFDAMARHYAKVNNHPPLPPRT